jgi:hypothetical protein
MASLHLAGTLKTLQGERARVRQALNKPDRAIDVIRELAGAKAAPNGHPKKHSMSAAARRKIATAQKLRWAIFRKRQQRKSVVRWFTSHIFRFEYSHLW